MSEHQKVFYGVPKEITLLVSEMSSETFHPSFNTLSILHMYY